METVSVLVVDDEPGIDALCKRVLSRAGYDVVALTDPRAAIEHLQNHKLDLLVVDIRMPEVDGFDVISRVQTLRPLFNVTETLFSETDRGRLLDLIVTAIRDHLHCSNVAYYQVEDGNVSIVAQRGRVLQVVDENFATQLILRVDADGNPIVISATGPGEANAQAMLSTLGLGS